MKKSAQQVLFIGNSAKGTIREIPVETLNEYDINTLIYQRGSVLKNEPSKIILNDIPCDFNGDYEIENLTIALDFFIEQSLNKKSNTIIVGNPFELFFQASLYGWLKENPNQIKNKKLSNSNHSNLTVLLFYPSTIEFENLRKEISQLIYVLKKHKINTFLIENHINQASATDNFLYYFDINEISQLEHKVKGLVQILGHLTVM
jgi:hypothetical protein